MRLMTISTGTVAIVYHLDICTTSGGKLESQKGNPNQATMPMIVAHRNLKKKA